MRAKLLTTVLRKGGAAASSLLTGLVAYWPMNEVSDGSISVPRVDIVGGISVPDQNKCPSSPDGKFGVCALLDGTNSRQMSVAAPSLYTDGDLSLCVWVNFSTGAPNRGLVNFDLKSKFDMGCHGGAASWTVNYWDNGYDTIIVNTTNDVWHLFCGWHDRTAQKYYLSVDNGTASSKDCPVQASYPYDNVLTFFMSPNTLAGKVGPIMYWKRVLTPTERTALWNGGDGIAYPF